MQDGKTASRVSSLHIAIPVTHYSLVVTASYALYQQLSLEGSGEARNLREAWAAFMESVSGGMVGGFGKKSKQETKPTHG
jgi:hypothetical protein